MIVSRSAGFLALLCCASPIALAQDVTPPPGVVATFDVEQRIEFSDNPDLDENGNSDVFGRTILSFGLDSITKVQRFRLGLGTDIEEFRDDENGDSEAIDFTNSFANLRYDRNTRNALLGFGLNYRESDTDSEFLDDDIDQDGSIITQDDGTRVSYGFDLEGAVGEQAPVGASFDWNYNEIEFKDTNDPDLNDSTFNQVSGQIDFRLSPRITTSLTAFYSDFDTEDPTGTDRETQGFGVASDLQVSPILTSNVSLSYDRIEREGGTNQTDEGFSGAFGLVRDMPNGTVGLEYRSEVSANDDGRRSFLSVDRNLQLPRGALFVSLGVTGADAVGSDPLIDVNYRHDLPTGQLSFGLSQRVVVDEDDDENINTSLRASYNQEINSLSSYGINLTFFDTNALDGGDDSQRYDIGLTYRRAVTRDWGLVGGINYTLLEEDGDPDRDRTTVFVGLQRSFEWSP